MFKPRWYIPKHSYSTAKAQIESELHDPHRSLELPEEILRLAHAEYARQHPGQSYERMQERGGLGVLESLRLLADYVERLEHEMQARVGKPPPGHSHL